MSLDIHALSVGRLERVIALRGFPGYHDLPPADVARIAARMGERRYKAGAIVQKEGKPLTHFHFVIRGEVEIRRGGRLLRRLGARSIVGGTSALAGDPKGYEIVAVKERRGGGCGGQFVRGQCGRQARRGVALRADGEARAEAGHRGAREIWWL